MTQRRSSNAGLTVPELLIVLGVIATMIAIIVGLGTELAHRLPRQWEARGMLDRICQGAVGYYETPQYDSMGVLLTPPRMPANQSATPAIGFCATAAVGGKCKYSHWTPTPVWQSMKVSPSPIYFYNSYAFSTLGSPPSQIGVAWAFIRYGEYSENICWSCYNNGAMAPITCPTALP